MHGHEAMAREDAESDPSFTTPQTSRVCRFCRSARNRQNIRHTPAQMHGHEVMAREDAMQMQRRARRYEGRCEAHARRYDNLTLSRSFMSPSNDE
jgi:hypothetical protein